MAHISVGGAMSPEELEIFEATVRIHRWFREQVLESIKPVKQGKRRPVFRPVHVEIAMNQPWSKRRQANG